MYELKQTPRQIVSELDEYIVGQHAAKICCRRFA